jgi:hypothetical protein
MQRIKNFKPEFLNYSGISKNTGGFADINCCNCFQIINCALLLIKRVKAVLVVDNIRLGYLSDPFIPFLRNNYKPKSSDNYANALYSLSLRAPEGCVAISLEKARLLRFTRNDNSYRWIRDKALWSFREIF